MSSSNEPGPARSAVARARALAVVSCLASATALLAALSGCGGGGGGDAPVPPPAPVPAPSPAPTPAPTGPIAAQMTVPTPVGYDAERLAAFNRLNEIRLSAGLGMVAQSTQMDQAAQAHAEWMVANDVFTHDEQEGTAGFTGTNWARRDEVFGYVPLSGGEVMSAPTHGAAGVDGLFNTVYHRAVLMAFEPVDVGIGWSGSSAPEVAMPLVIDLTRPGTDVIRGWGQSAQARIDGASAWPLDGAREVPCRLGLENPNPVPSQDVLSLGTPASITVDETSKIAVSKFILTEKITGAIVPAQVLSSDSDPNLLLPRSFVALVPLSPLSASTTYLESFVGSATEFATDASIAISKSWTFTTGAQ